VQAADDTQLSKTIARYGRVDLRRRYAYLYRQAAVVSG